MNKYDTVGIDLDAMSVNDCFVHRGQAAAFPRLPGHAKDDPPLTKALIKGISDGCIEGDCALWGAKLRFFRFLSSGRLRTWPASASAWSSASTSSTAKHSTGRRCPRPGQLGLAFQWLQPGAQSVFDHAGLSVDQFVRRSAHRGRRPCSSRRASTCGHQTHLTEHYPVKSGSCAAGAHHGRARPIYPRILPPDRRVF